eukprot:313028-Chlamydomonas_euryale.AAC.1
MLVFSKVAARLGGKVKIVISGGAPLSAHVEEFLRVAMCCPVVQVCALAYPLWYSPSHRPPISPLLSPPPALPAPVRCPWT